MSGTQLKFVWRALGILPSKAVEKNLSLLAKALERGLESARKEAKITLEASVPVKTGSLKKKVKFYGEPNGFRVTMNSEYAGIQNSGGWITAKGNGWLRIPLPSGRQAPKGERGDFTFRSKKGEVLVANRMPNRGMAVIAVLKKKVYIKPTGFLRKAEEAAKAAYKKVFDSIMGVNSGNT